MRQLKTARSHDASAGARVRRTHHSCLQLDDSGLARPAGEYMLSRTDNGAHNGTVTT